MYINPKDLPNLIKQAEEFYLENVKLFFGEKAAEMKKQELLKEKNNGNIKSV